MCVNYGALNNRTVNRCPFPSIQSILSTLGGFTVPRKIEIVSGIHQILIHDDAIEKTAFNTQFGALEWVVMPFGLCKSASTFQGITNDVFGDRLGGFVWVYIEDILIFSNNARNSNNTLTWYTSYYNNTSCSPASISPPSSNHEFPFAGTSSIRMEYTWPPRRSGLFEVGLPPPPSMKLDNSSATVDSISNFSKDSRP